MTRAPPEINFRGRSRSFGESPCRHRQRRSFGHLEYVVLQVVVAQDILGEVVFNLAPH